ncbi:Stk1 family PASTA domain-containing Ser/Thr kinase [Mycobacterium sp. URHB0044]|uniref:Stk1 family PASTA domain-containing Ser/Thr kinase n=1 Tax=Mycobacterium sp. URHB0044 TaxID=1380386 RepID=UPI00048BEFDB|nr:Stk1 family PASTA domain-containing Ser/Thr kinase [Mycobacterium sp. URHB0044]
MTTPQHLSDRYEVGEILGFGGMSEVHLARDLRLHRDVAVKVLRTDLARDPSFYLRFRREAQNAAALNHPAIVAVYDTGETQTADGPLPYIVMEYVNGVTLRDIVHTEGPMDATRAIEVIADACQALNFSHQHGIIHRDVKPANIMISKAGAVKVMDFGIARALADGGNRLTKTSAVIGTAQYLSPEQASGDSSVDARSDVYSLGCVLYEMLTGEPPFVGDSPVAVAYQHVRKAPVPPSQRHDGISPELDAVVLKALTKNPENRYQTAADMRADLIRVHSGEAPEAPKLFTDAERTTMTSAPASHRRSHPTQQISVPTGDPGRGRSVGRWLMAGAILAVLALVVTVGINVIGTRPTQQIPDLSGKSEEVAVRTLQDRGFKTTVERQENSGVDKGLVISTNPAANEAAAEGDEITVNVSAGAKEVKVPDVAGMSPDAAQDKLKDAGFKNLKPTAVPHPIVPKGTVIGTVPAANQTTAVTDEITIQVSSGTGTAEVPDCARQTVDVCRELLRVSGFNPDDAIAVDADGVEPPGQVVGTDPPARAVVPVETPIQIKVSRGNQITMPNLMGKVWDEVVPLMQSKGWDGPWDNHDVPAGDGNRAKVISQEPQAGQPVLKTGTIKLTFGA